MRNFQLRSVRLQMVINPSCEYGRLHGGRPRLRQSLHPQIQIRPCGVNRPFSLHLTTRVLYAIADCLLVNI